jgi:asparagine synthase (glutamine-hydrolysing)
MGSDGHLLSLYLISRQLFSPLARKRLIDPRAEGRLRNGTFEETAGWLIEEINGLDTFSGISLLEMRCYLANMLLRDGDFMSMAHGLEIRVPFLDHKLVECVFSIPTETKLRNGFPKPLLLRSVLDEMPKDIFRRSKMGFSFPWEIWLRNRLRHQVDELFYETPDTNETGLNVEECRNLWRRFLGHKKGMNWARVWALYVLLFWVRKNISA